jgi:hypothetical protein
MKVTTMQGKVIDVGALMAQNETAVAVGNANMNARGDILGAGGQIVKRKEQVAQDYHKRNPNAVKSVSLKDIQADVSLTPADAVARAQQAKKDHDAAKAQVGKKTIIDSDD